MAEPIIDKLTSGRLLARNTIINLIGQATPMLAAVFAIPVLIKGLGTERFGVLTLAWMLVGYFSLFDLGLGRAMTQLAAKKLGTEQEHEIPALVWTTQSIMVVLGLIGTLVITWLSPWLVQGALKIPEELQFETLRTFYLLGASIPVVISTSGFRGLLEAQQRFGLINALRIPLGIFTFLGPVMVLPFSQDIFWVVAVLTAGRFIAYLAHLLICFRVMPLLCRGVVVQWSVVKPLLRFGGWMTVTNIVSPLMAYLDRFLIGTLVSVTSVAYYATPYEVVSNLGLIPAALVGVLFPAFAATFVQDSNRTELFLRRGIKYTFLALFPLTLLIVTFAPDGLKLWLGDEFAKNSTGVLQWLAIGRFINGLAQIPFALIQSIGYPDLTAKLHLVELPFYLLMAWWLISTHGIEGAAIAWVARVAVDTLVLFCMAQRLLPSNKFSIRRMMLIMGAALIVLFIASLSAGIVIKGFFIVVTLSFFTLLSWCYILDEVEKQRVFSVFSQVY